MPLDLSRIASRASSRLSRLGASAQALVRYLDPLRKTEASYLLLIVTMGVIGAMVGLLYRLGLRLFQVIYFASDRSILAIAEDLTWPQRLIAPAVGERLDGVHLEFGWE